MKVTIRNIRRLREIPVVVNDNGMWEYGAPVNFFEHVVRCTGWPHVIDMHKKSQPFDAMYLESEQYLAQVLFDHIVLAKRLVIETLDPEFCAPSDRWSKPAWIDMTTGPFAQPRLRCAGGIPWDLYDDEKPVSTLKTMVKRVLTGDSSVVAEGYPFLIVGDRIACQHMEENVWYDLFVPRESERGKNMEVAYRRKERET